VGVVCRDDKAMFLGASVVVFDGITEPSILEAHACREAHVLAGDLQLQRLKIASDFLSVVNDINSGMSYGQHANTA
jgi:hypothetical protein